MDIQLGGERVQRLAANMDVLRSFAQHYGTLPSKDNECLLPSLRLLAESVAKVCLAHLGEPDRLAQAGKVLVSLTVAPSMARRGEAMCH